MSLKLVTIKKNFGPKYPHRNRIWRGQWYEKEGRQRFMRASEMCERILRQRMTEDGPEADVWLAVIIQAIDDYTSPEQYVTDHEISDARDFLLTRRVDDISSIIGIDGEYVNDLVQHVMGDEKQVYERGFFEVS